MAFLIIPASSDASLFRQTTTLEGRSYELTFRWSQREDRWSLDLAHNGEVLVAGIRLVANWPLLRLHKSNPLVPQGELFALDTTGQGQDPGLRDLDQRVKLVYIEASEFASGGA